MYTEEDTALLDDYLNQALGKDTFRARPGVLALACGRLWGSEQGYVVFSSLLDKGFIAVDHLGWTYRTTANVGRMVAAYKEKYEQHHPWDATAVSFMQSAMQPRRSDAVRWAYFCKFMELVDEKVKTV